MDATESVFKPNLLWIMSFFLNAYPKKWYCKWRLFQWYVLLGEEDREIRQSHACANVLTHGPKRI